MGSPGIPEIGLTTGSVYVRVRAVSEYQVQLEIAGPFAMSARPDTSWIPALSSVQMWLMRSGLFPPEV